MYHSRTIVERAIHDMHEMESLERKFCSGGSYRGTISVTLTFACLHTALCFFPFLLSIVYIRTRDQQIQSRARDLSFHYQDLTTMRFVYFSLLALSGHAVAQHVHMDIPEVSSYVASVQSLFAPYTTGPRPSTRKTTTKTSTTTSSTPTSTPTSSCSFWMENIAHQGYAAFNANPSSYTVFRNVKNFGAKGRLIEILKTGHS